LNGIYGGGPTKFKEGLVDGVHGVSYGESTIKFSSDEEYQEDLHTYVEGFGFEHRMKKQQILNCGIGTVSTGWFRRKKYSYNWNYEIPIC